MCIIFLSRFGGIIYDALNNFVKLHSVLISMDVYLYFLINLKIAR